MSGLLTVSELVAKKSQRLRDAVQRAGVRWRWWWGVNHMELLLISRCSRETGHILLLHRCGTDVRPWDGRVVSVLPPADTRHHWRDVRTANVWVPNWNSDFWWVDAALTFNHAGALVRLQTRMSNMMIRLFSRHQITNYHRTGQKMKPLGDLLYHFHSGGIKGAAWPSLRSFSAWF